ncbi:MAG: NUDIX domain-containing protein [Patescibacteria group bacterium]|nr:NUDIX domain-containing protein [Patescibacteria group bacterium]
MKTSKQIVKITGVIGIIENERGEILISQRFNPEVPKAHLKWDVPGGKIETGETSRQALLREIAEETGLNVKILKKLKKPISAIWEHQDYILHITLHAYHCHFVNGKLHLNDPKIHDLKWIKKSEIANFDFLPTTKSFLSLIKP